MGNSNSLFESIFKQKISAADTLEFLTKTTAEHPYFSPAHFFLLLNTKKGTRDYQQLAAKTSVLFNNPYWLQFQLQEEELSAREEREAAGVEDEKKVVPSEDQLNISSPSTVPVDNFDSGETTLGNTEEINVNKSVPLPEDPIILHQSENLFNDIEEKDTGPVIDENHLLELEESIQEPVHPLILQQSETLFNDIEEKDTGPVIDENHLLELEESIQMPAGEGIAGSVDSNSLICEEQNNEDVIITEKEIETIASEDADFSQRAKKEGIPEEAEINRGNHENLFSNATENGSDTTEISHSGHFNSQDSPLINEPEPEDEPVTEEEIAPLNFKLNIDTVSTTEDKITFEPLHTSDYFASLGIKLSSDIKPGDKLGKQLKSFTEWLKTMKKVHGDQLAPLSGQADMSIQKLAEQSNKEDTVATEAMADVLLMQGKKEKAIEVYKKLSLLNPSKSVYFAAKIDQLKEH